MGIEPVVAGTLCVVAFITLFAVYVLLINLYLSHRDKKRYAAEVERARVMTQTHPELMLAVNTPDDVDMSLFQVTYSSRKQPTSTP